jgi:hypothetical protein
MSYNTVFFDKQNHLLCISEGEISSLDDYIAWAIAVIDKCKEAGLFVVLIDNRTLVFKLTLHEIASFADRLETFGAAPLSLKVAVISCPDNLELSKSVEISLLNRSADYKSFKSQKEAMEWLGV